MILCRNDVSRFFGVEKKTEISYTNYETEKIPTEHTNRERKDLVVWRSEEKSERKDPKISSRELGTIDG